MKVIANFLDVGFLLVWITIVSIIKMQIPVWVVPLSPGFASYGCLFFFHLDLSIKWYQWGFKTIIFASTKPDVFVAIVGSMHSK